MSIQNLFQPNDYDIFGKNITCENVDLITINDQPYPPGGGAIPALIPNRFLRTNNVPTMQWSTITASDLTNGLPYQILHTDAFSNVEWTNDLRIPGTLISVGNATINQNLLVQGSTILDSNVDCNQVLNVDGDLFANDTLTVSNDLGVTNGSLTVYVGDTLVQSINVDNQLKFGGVAGLNNQIITSDGSGIPAWSTLTPSIIQPGSLNQVLITNVLPGPILAPVWSDDLDLPGLLNVNGAITGQSTMIINGASSLLGSATITGLLVNGSGSTLGGTIGTNITTNLLMNGSSGTTGQYLVKTSGTAQTWQTPPNVKIIRYVAYLAGQDLNAGVGPTAITFDTLNVVSNIANGSTSSVTGISQSSSSQFTIGTTGIYDVDLTILFNNTSTGIGNSVIQLYAEVNGFGVNRSIITNNSSYTCSGKIPSINLTAGNILKILVVRVAGTNTLNTNNPPLNFASTIAITLVNSV